MFAENFIRKNEFSNDSFSLSLDDFSIIYEQMKNCICKIFPISGGYGSGSFCKIPLLGKLGFLPTLITNYHVFNENEMFLSKEIKISLNNDKIFKTIYLDYFRKIFLNKKLDITIIEIKEEDGFNFNDFLEIDDSIFHANLTHIYNRKKIYLLHYPHGKTIKYSYGYITKINNKDYNIKYNCLTEKGSSGAPIINLSNYKIIGIHKGSLQFCKLGIFIKNPLECFHKEMNVCKNIINNKYNIILYKSLSLRNSLLYKIILKKKYILTYLQFSKFYSFNKKCDEYSLNFYYLNNSIEQGIYINRYLKNSLLFSNKNFIINKLIIPLFTKLNKNDLYFLLKTLFDDFYSNIDIKFSFLKKCLNVKIYSNKLAKEIIINSSNEKTSKNQENNILSTILFDEMGLKEISPYYPLKTIHSELDNNYKSELDYKNKIRLIGISNFTLDPPKMNRIINLFIPDLDKDVREIYWQIIKQLAESYNEYKGFLKKNYFMLNDLHGTRDFYCLIKIFTAMLKNNFTQNNNENKINMDIIERNSSFEIESEKKEKEKKKKEGDKNNKNIFKKLGQDEKQLKWEFDNPNIKKSEHINNVIPVLLEGPTGTSKTRTTLIANEYINKILNKKSKDDKIISNNSVLIRLRFDLIAETKIDTLLKKFGVDKNSASVLKIKEGQFLKIYAKRNTFLFDPINLTSREVLQYILRFLNSKSLSFEYIGKVLKIHKMHQNFRIIATQNLNKRAFAKKRQDLGIGFLSRFHKNIFPDLTKEELIDICKGFTKQNNYKGNKKILIDIFLLHMDMQYIFYIFKCLSSSLPDIPKWITQNVLI